VSKDSKYIGLLVLVTAPKNVTSERQHVLAEGGKGGEARQCETRGDKVWSSSGSGKVPHHPLLINGLLSIKVDYSVYSFLSQEQIEPES